ICAPAAVGGAYECTTGCPPTAPLLCGTECVSPLVSVNHCGACTTKCPDVDQGIATCTVGLCSFTCKQKFHACAGRCVASDDPPACGPLCTVCPAPPNATAVCETNACGFTCVPGAGDCNRLPADGCEAVFASDPLNCGGCGISCHGGACNAGVCAPPPDDAGA